MDLSDEEIAISARNLRVGNVYHVLQRPQVRCATQSQWTNSSVKRR